MKTSLSYAMTGVLAALAMASGALAQQVTQPDAAAAKPTVAPLPSSAPEGTQTAPADQTATATATAAVPAGPDAKEFMRQAFLSNEFGIAAAQVALANAKDADAKAAAQQIMTDGMKTRQDLVAAIQGATTDMHFDQTWTDDYKTKLADLKSTSGDDFDAKYLQTQGDVTNQMTQLFSSYASSGTDQSVKTFAANTLPTLQTDADKLSAASQGGQ